MPDFQALIRYIDERRVLEGDGIGYSFVRDLPPTIRDTFFAASCLKMLKADSPDDGIVRFLSGYDDLDFNGAYYAMKSLKLVGADVEVRGGRLWWCYRGDETAKPCTIPDTPLISYFKYELYGMYGSSIFSSSLSSVLKRIELDPNSKVDGLVNAAISLLDLGSRQDIMTTYMALEIMKALERRCCPITLSSARLKQITSFLKRCTARMGYVGSPNASSVTLESTYAGHKIAQYLKIPRHLGVSSFVESLQNDNGGFRRSKFGGISSLESCYLAMSLMSRD